MTAAQPSGPLGGVTVVDLTHALAGPYCTMVLADLGADVLKVESPEGDGSRRMGPYAPDDSERHFGGYFNSVNRNKRSICLDLRQEEAREALEQLIATADVLVENFRAGVMDRLGFSYERLHDQYPALVYAAIRGFGDNRTGNHELPESPYRDWPAYDVVAQAMGGLTAITGPVGGPPINAGAPAGDIVPALFSTVGIVSALRHAERTGEGQFIDVSMYDAVLALCERSVYQYSYNGEVATPQGTGNPQICPFDAFPTKDGWVTIAAPGDHHWRLLCELMGRFDMVEDPRFETNLDRVAHCAAIREAVTAWTTDRTKAEVVAELAPLVPCGPVNTIEDIVVDPHTARREMLVHIPQPGSNRDVYVAGTPLKMTTTSPGIRTRAPLLGEHTSDTLARLGYTPTQLAALRESGVIK